jgi:hypothetical protein
MVADGQRTSRDIRTVVPQAVGCISTAVRMLAGQWAG